MESLRCGVVLGLSRIVVSRGMIVPFEPWPGRRIRIGKIERWSELDKAT